MSYNMTGEEYELLYKRYLTRSPKEMLEMAGMKQGMAVLDLCCGSNGRASKAALEMGASYVCAVDENPMAVKLRTQDIDVFSGTIDDFFNQLNVGKAYMKCMSSESKVYPCIKFDLVICQQAINYWIKDDSNIHYIKEIMNVGAKFVFNTFNKCPSEKVTVKQYDIDGRSYVEMVNYYKNAQNISEDYTGVIYHTQAVNGLPPHHTEFAWISPEEYRLIFSCGWDVEVKTDNNTDIYICTKIT